MTWQPWKDFEDEPIGKPLPITEPPCKNCFFWRPVILSPPHDLRCCHVLEQFHDFSCFKERD